MTHSSVHREYAQTANHYEARWADYVARSHGPALTQLPPGFSGRLLDAGCGTGLLLARLARQCPATQLVGIDLTSKMLAVARHRLPQSVGLAVATLESLPFDSGAFDWVVSTSVLHFAKSPEVAVRELARVMAPGGQLLVTDWDGDAWSMRLLGQWMRWSAPEARPALTRAQLQRLLVSAGLHPKPTQLTRLRWPWSLQTVVSTR
jgi:ubiquinone/menaquinone biosynthesis C-methylase UbiE